MDVCYNMDGRTVKSFISSLGKRGAYTCIRGEKNAKDQITSFMGDFHLERLILSIKILFPGVIIEKESFSVRFKILIIDLIDQFQNDVNYENNKLPLICVVAIPNQSVYRLHGFITHLYPSRPPRLNLEDKDFDKSCVNVCVTQALQRDNPNAKDTDWINQRSLIENQIRKYQYKEKAIDEIIIVDEFGCLLEGFISNCFVITNNGEVFTASSEEILVGHMRQYIIEVCKAMGLKLVFQKPSLRAIDQWKGMFISSTTKCVALVKNIYLDGNGSRAINCSTTRTGTTTINCNSKDEGGSVTSTDRECSLASEILLKEFNYPFESLCIKIQNEVNKRFIF